MDKLNLQLLLDKINTVIVAPVMKIFKTMPPESIPIILAAAGALALLASLVAYLIIRPSSKKQSSETSGKEKLISSFKDNGVILDIALPDAHENVLARAVITDIKEDRLSLEIVYDMGLSEQQESGRILLMFPPEKTATGTVNSFKVTIATLQCKKEGCSRLSTTLPQAFSAVIRRRHKRKKVIDQQFIRVKIWLGKPDTDDASFADSIPDLAVNSYDPRSGGHEDNEVINISNGGLAISTPLILSENKFDTDTDVLINIFMFNFRQKIFKPYWYAGKIRTVENINRASCRLGVGFTMSGTIRDENEQFIDWVKI
ncbi:PilZ domain-containing protein [Desulfovibrio gilichinskyi]|uniref:PilZ domain-containing protein n=1 Tax=Desulfovibrio gilichinskyi TaxID=1519643 RepID=A0A1X7DPF4_9BACT|nr:PilZ domain-containing protein [Desulfovibrio gilichinskyi]SMF19055.1 PilZ domain-containing protein [Desulfovibrio gilichinskyi]